MFFQKEQPSRTEAFSIGPELMGQLAGLDLEKLNRLAAKLDYRFQLNKLSPVEMGYLLYELAQTSGYRVDQLIQQKSPRYKGNIFIETIVPAFLQCCLSFKDIRQRMGGFVSMRAVKGGGQQENEN